MQDTALRWESKHAELLKQIEFQKEQLDGKRALWMDANPGSSARRDAMKSVLRDPFHSPTAAQANNSQASGLGSMTSPSFVNANVGSFANQPGGQLGPPQFKRLESAAYDMNYQNSLAIRASTERNFGGKPKAPRPTQTGTPPSLGNIMHLPPGVGSSSGYAPPYASNHQSHPGISAGPPNNQYSTSTAIVRRDPEDERRERLAVEYKVAIQDIYDLIQAWVRRYANIPNPENDRKTASSNDMLWDYMMNCAYPGNRQDSHSHIVALLSDRATKHWFIMRLAAQYCVKDIMGIEAFKPYSKQVAMVIDEMLEKLKTKGEFKTV
jgi:hypothetical protein